jgi:1-acyl-sn-glycerol-3-phosphate acyltransferase
LLYGITVAIFIVSLFFTSRIHFEEDITQFIPDDGEMKTANTVFRNIKIRDRIVIHLSQTDTSQNPDRLIDYCDSLTNLLSPLIPDYVKNIISQVQDDMIDDVYDLVYDHLPVFLEEDDYVIIDSMLTQKAIATRLQSNYTTLSNPSGFAMRRFIAADPLAINALALRHLQQLQPDKQYNHYRQHIFTKDLRHLLFFLVPESSGTESAHNAEIVDHLDESIDHLKATFPEITAEYFGGPAVSVCNARQIRQDTMLTLNIALIVILLFFIIAFRSKRNPVLMLLPVLFGGAVSLMILYFIKGSVSAITIGAGSIVIGIALNYSIHVISHSKHSRSPREVVAGLSFPLTLGSLTTIGAFLGLTFAKSQALADFGLFSAFCLMGSALFCLTVLPHLLPKKQKEAKESKLLKSIERIASYQPEKQRVLLIIMGVFSIVCLFFIGKTRFDSDMMNLNYMDKKLQQAEKNLELINSDPGKNTVYLVSTGSDLQEAELNELQNRKKIAGLQDKGLITHHASADIFLIPEKEQEIRIHRWNSFWTKERKNSLKNQLFEEGKKLKFSEKAFIPFLELLDEDYRPVDFTKESWVKDGLLSEWLTETEGMSMILSQITIPEGQKAEVYQQLDGIDNLVIFDRSYFASKFVRIISDDFYLILFISSFIVFFALLITYGRMELTLMTFAPMALSWIWISGIMGMTGIGFNIVNIIVSTFIFGLGDDYSIFITDGLTEEYKSGKKTLSFHKTAIFMSTFAMIVGTGVLIFAKHPALKSIALISTFGMLSVVLIAYTVQPFLFRFFISGRTAKGKYPYTLRSLLCAIFFYLVFGSGCILLSIISVLLKIVPFPSKKKKYALHWLMSKLSKAVLHGYPLMKIRLMNQAGENFKQPAVIVANHQSFLDILRILALYPKMIMLVNKWVWYSPVFGLLVRNAGFYCVEEGVEKSLEKARSLVDDGYSIVVFPEGTRSIDGIIKRFHNGAFYLAQQLQLDVLPIVMHGNGQVMPKNDPFYIRNGWLSTEILPRIGNDELRQKTVRENAHDICHLIREHYAKMEKHCDVPENPYFRNKLVTNYIYKGPVLEWYLRIKLRMEHNYKLFDEMIPQKAVISDLGCGYGFLSYMLAFLSKDRTITGVDYDHTKIDVANHCFSHNQQVQFIGKDISVFDLTPCDVMILSDVLHYLLPEKQEALLQRCVENLNPGGMIIIRDANRNMNKAHQITKLTEFFSTRLFRFNKTTNPLHFLSEKDIRNFAEKNRLSCQSRNNDKHTSNVIYQLQQIS